jgi:hypothetical protein
MPDLDDDLPSGDTTAAAVEIDPDDAAKKKEEGEESDLDGFSPRQGVVYDYYYENYLMLYSLYGRGRPKLNRERYEDLDRELLRLVTTMQEATGDTSPQLTRTAFNRIRELEYMLLDDVAESLLDQRGKAVPQVANALPEKKETATKLEFHWSDDAGSLAP